VQVSGQVAVMMINGLLCKVIFDQNPTNEFYIEESFPLDWMYPYETPFGIIMKINRQPLPSLPESSSSRITNSGANTPERLIGNWITYDTSVKEIPNSPKKFTCGIIMPASPATANSFRDDTAQKASPSSAVPSPGFMPSALARNARAEYRPKNDTEISAAHPRGRLRLQAVVCLLSLQPGSRVPLRQPAALAQPD